MKKFIIAVAVVIMAAFAVPAFAAMNPFMDVPASHWAYDAVAQLASRGVISGYPDGSYKGAQPATRYEMASIVARALAKVDMEKASKQDVDMLKKLIIEFKDELDALGVKVDRLDARVAVLEGDIGGWGLSGQFRFDANFGMDGSKRWYNDDMRQNGDNDFDLNRYRIFLTNRINETTSFTARIGNGDAVRQADAAYAGGSTVRWERYFITTKLPFDISMTVGRAEFNWEDDAGLVAANGPLFGDYVANMFWFKKDWGMANLELVVARLGDHTGWQDSFQVAADGSAIFNAWEERFLIAGRAHFDINEKFMAGVMAYYEKADDDFGNAITGNSDGLDLTTVGIYAGFNFTPDIALKGLFYFQDQGDGYASYAINRTTGAWTGAKDDDANAWKVILDVSQEALKFTSLWLEFGQMDNNFRGTELAGNVNFAFNGANMLANRGRSAFDSKSTIYGAVANQQWNDKWRSYLGYYKVDFDTNGLDDTSNWTLGVAYRLNPAVEFELSYDNIDYGDTAINNWGGRRDDDHQIRFRTFVTF